jgi:hypothetical protein
MSGRRRTETRARLLFGNNFVFSVFFVVILFFSAFQRFSVSVRGGMGWPQQFTNCYGLWLMVYGAHEDDL